jgi:RNA 2',3'-cyclic 3'-phosphodiesterase
MVALALRAREALARAGYRGDDKDFRAHLTLARVREGARTDGTGLFLRRHGQDELGSFPVETVCLYQSKLSPKGPAYEALSVARLEA